MALKTINDSTLTNIAQAIRSKTGDSANLTPLQMPAAISSIATSKFQYKNIGYVAVRNTGGYFSSIFEVPDNLTSIDQVLCIINQETRNVWFRIPGILKPIVAEGYNGTPKNISSLILDDGTTVYESSEPTAELSFSGAGKLAITNWTSSSYGLSKPQSTTYIIYGYN